MASAKLPTFISFWLHAFQHLYFELFSFPIADWQPSFNMSDAGTTEKSRELRLPFHNPTTTPQPSQSKHPRTTLRTEITAFIGEFIGTFMFLSLAFTGTQIALNAAGSTELTSTDHPAPDLSKLLYIAFAFGVSLAINVAIFADVSGGKFNPAVSQSPLVWFTFANSRSVRPQPPLRVTTTPNRSDQSNKERVTHANFVSHERYRSRQHSSSRVKSTGNVQSKPSSHSSSPVWLHRASYPHCSPDRSLSLLNSMPLSASPAACFSKRLLRRCSF
jgi:hypothetical protein